MNRPNKADIRKLERRLRKWEGWLGELTNADERAAAKSLIRTGQQRLLRWTDRRNEIEAERLKPKPKNRKTNKSKLDLHQLFR